MRTCNFNGVTFLGCLNLIPLVTGFKVKLTRISIRIPNFNFLSSILNFPSGALRKKKLIRSPHFLPFLALIAIIMIIIHIFTVTVSSSAERGESRVQVERAASI